MKGEDKDRIESLTKALADASAKMAEWLYAQSGAGDTGGAGPGGGEAGGQQSSAGGGQDDVVDTAIDSSSDEEYGAQHTVSSDTEST
jgi:molecular chaperone DnaK